MLLLPENMMQYMRRVGGMGLVDTCQRMVFASADSDYGPDTGEPSYTAGATLACLFKPRPATDAQGDSAVLIVDADLYLERDVTLNPSDRVRITKLHGDLVASPQTFAISSGPVVGKTLMHAELSLVTDGSDEEE